MQDPGNCSAQCCECWIPAGAASSRPWFHSFVPHGGRKASGRCVHLWQLLDFHAISFEKAWGSQQRYVERESRHRAQAPPVDNWDVGGFLAFQRHQQKVRTSPLPHSPFLRRHHRHCLIRKTSSVWKTLPTPAHCRYSMCSRFALVSLGRAAIPACSPQRAPRGELTGVCSTAASCRQPPGPAI